MIHSSFSRSELLACRVAVGSVPIAALGCVPQARYCRPAQSDSASVVFLSAPAGQPPCGLSSIWQEHLGRDRQHLPVQLGPAQPEAVRTNPAHPSVLLSGLDARGRMWVASRVSPTWADPSCGHPSRNDRAVEPSRCPTAGSRSRRLVAKQATTCAHSVKVAIAMMGVLAVRATMHRTSRIAEAPDRRSCVSDP